MPTFGNTTGSGWASASTSAIRGALADSPSVDGMAQSMSVKTSNWGSGEKITLALYDDAGNFIAATEELSTGSDAGTWSQFDFVSPIAVYSSTSYICCVWCDSYYNQYYDSGQPSKKYIYDASNTYDNWPDPASVSTGTNSYAVYCTYDEAPTDDGTPARSLHIIKR